MEWFYFEWLLKQLGERRTAARLILALVVVLLGLGIGCGPIPAPKPPTLRDIAVIVTDQGQSLPSAVVTLGTLTQATGPDGVVTFHFIPAASQTLSVTVAYPGCQPYTQPATLAASINQQIDVGGRQTEETAILLPALNCHVDPSGFSLERLAQIRGAMWTARLNLPYGPRPNRDDNILPMVFYEVFSPEDRERMLTQYHDVEGYTHAVTGPVTGNDCYHNLYPCRQGLPTQEQWDAYLDTIQEWWDAGIVPVYFAKPDGWETPDHAADMDALDALYRQPRAQRLLRVVCYPGWEPSGSKYGWTNATYVAWVKRGADVFPNALRLLHTISELDAPTGGHDDQIPDFTNGKAWANVAPYIHGWLGQWDGYTNGSNPQPTPQFLDEWVKVFGGRGSFRTRFEDPALYPDWPKGSAWGPTRRLLVFAGEYAAYGNFWKNFPESVAIQLGDLAVQAGADGCLDGCSVAIPEPRR